MNTNEQHIIDELKKGTTPVPVDNYFAQLKQNIFDRLEPTVKIIPLYRKSWFITAVAASIALVISLTFFFDGNETQQPSIADVDWNSVSRDEVLAYIDENIDDFETEALAQQLNSIPEWSATVDITGTASAGTNKTGKEDKYDRLFKDVDKQDILEYLEEEDIDLEELSPQ
ncbi:MAG: hypothetical protein A3D31_05490 [Candidatus Fluviicola riflensis]|nr:MAG: hypothetical protein CHH17_09525 [Candidatus Fluviicola riflensis]OGS79422.1 MAG: hypothetical protein A3D31_05490 [Candidatus Fluviicola riflensis]OGS86854.1 MAG: hypothetical protein A2724_04950 [Fluviicola sp. RIFCSPHIGHO2_01_FULL_43_53]OGS89644.1 MAG: hypothetical protein A3E30_01695 [Fluviicola sp. RIFCSPHIGHO2_12_FULL_43_24]